MIISSSEFKIKGWIAVIQKEKGGSDHEHIYALLEKEKQVWFF
jgi:hypothetical protein